MRHLSDEDLDVIGVLLDERILQRINQLEETMASLADVLADEQAEGGEITQLVEALNTANETIAQLQAQLSGADLPPNVQSEVDAIFTQAEQNKAALTAAIPAVTTPPGTAPTSDAPPTDQAPAQPVPDVPGSVTPTPGPATFVAKINGELFTDYQDRVNAWNANAANAGNEIVALDEPSWTALPIS